MYHKRNFRNIARVGICLWLFEHHLDLFGFIESESIGVDRELEIVTTSLQSCSGSRCIRFMGVMGELMPQCHH